MKQCRIVHINDGRPETNSNGNFYFSETYPRAERELEQYLNQGYQVKSMVHHVCPGDPAGGYAFFDAGFTFYLEREVSGEEPEEDAQEDGALGGEPETFEELFRMHGGMDPDEEDILAWEDGTDADGDIWD